MVCLGGWVCGVEVSSGVRSSDDSKDSIFVEFDRFKAEAARESKPSDPLKYPSRASFIGSSEEVGDKLCNVVPVLLVPFKSLPLLFFSSAASFLSCRCGIFSQLSCFPNNNDQNSIKV
jgi:hypothetical protein